MTIISNAKFNILFFALIILLSTIIVNNGDTDILKSLWNISTMNPFFADIRVITGYNETVMLGKNPLIDNIGDPWGRPMNYPPIWALFAEITKIDHNDAFIFGVFNISLYIVGFLLFTNNLVKNSSLSIALLLTFFSPASIMVMERGNIDMIVFFLVSISILAIYYNKVSIFFILTIFASIIKVFPIVTIVALSNKKIKKFIIYSSISLFIFGLYIALNLEHFYLIKQGTPQPTGFAYGFNVIWMIVNKKLGYDYGLVVKIFSYVILLFWILFLFKTYRDRECFHISNSYSLESFKIGSLIFLFTFMLNNNFDYRLVFLIFVIPQMLEWCFDESLSKKIRILSAVGIFSIIYTMWYLVLIKVFGLIAAAFDEILNSITFFILSYLYILSISSQTKILNQKS